MKGQIKAGFVPRHYSLTLDDAAMLDLILTLRVARDELDVSPDVEEVLAKLEKVYQGDLPERPGEPIPYTGEDDEEAVA